MKTYYSEFAAHALRCWARGHKPANEAGVLSEQGVIRALSGFSEHECRILKDLYSTKKPFNIVITDYAVTHSTTEGKLWDLVRKVERRVAKECGII